MPLKKFQNLITNKEPNYCPVVLIFFLVRSTSVEQFTKNEITFYYFQRTDQNQSLSQYSVIKSAGLETHSTSRHKNIQPAIKYIKIAAAWPPSFTR